MDFEALTWTDDDEFSINGRGFRIGPPDLATAGSVDPAQLYKTRQIIERYAALFERFAPPEPLVLIELGIYRGGSMVFWNELGSPRLHVGIDYNVDPRIHAFDDYCATQDVHPHWGVDQADAQAISRILDSYGSPPLSLVIDDASHKLASTISSFDILFPHLAPGGLYVIEDWAWSYDAEFLAANPKWRHHPELASIIPRLHSMLAEHPDYIEQIVSTPDFLVARRGPGQLAPRLGEVPSRTWDRDAQRRRRTTGFRHRLRRGR